VQRTLVFDSLTVGGVNRARKVHVTAAGKAVNAARAITTLGGAATLISFLGGDAGRFVARGLDADAPTRTCTTLIPKDGPVTELVEEAPPVSAGDVAALEAMVERRLG
jgi:fructose-1-phosphate kinase PfkB-like protein